jgi:NitT/TauT family transport system substrate-binding protein
MAPLAKGVPLKVVLVNDNSAGNDAVMASPKLKTMQALKGKTVALEEFSVSHFLLVTALTKNGMTPADVKIVNLSAGDAAAAFIAGRVDAATVWNPWVNQIELSGKGQALFTSKNIPGLIPDLLVAQEKSLAANRKEYLGMVKAWFDVVKFLQDKPDEAAKIMAKVVGMEPAEYKVFLPGTRFFGPKENLEAFGTASDSKALTGSAPVILKFLDDNKLIEGKPDYAKALDASLVKEATKR